MNHLIKIFNLLEIEKIFEFLELKIVLASIFIFIAQKFNGHVQIVCAIFLLIFFDTITGVWNAWRNNEISSKGLKRTLQKLFVYYMMLLISRLVDDQLPMKLASPAMDAFLVTTEAVSILENISKLGYPTPTFLIKRLKDFNKK